MDKKKTKSREHKSFQTGVHIKPESSTNEYFSLKK